MDFFRRLDDGENEKHSIVFGYTSQWHVVTVELASIGEDQPSQRTNYVERMRQMMSLAGYDGTERGYLIRCVASTRTTNLWSLLSDARDVYVKDGPRQDRSIRMRYELDNLLDVALAYVPPKLTVVHLFEHALESKAPLVMRHLIAQNLADEPRTRVCTMLRTIGRAYMGDARDRAEVLAREGEVWTGLTVGRDVRRDTGWTNQARIQRPPTPDDPEWFHVCPYGWCGHWFPNTVEGCKKLVQHRRTCQPGVHDPLAPVLPGFLPLMGQGVHITNARRTGGAKKRAVTQLTTLYRAYAARCAQSNRGPAGQYACELTMHPEAPKIGDVKGLLTHHAAVQTLDGRVFWSESPSIWVRLAGLTHAMAIETAARMIYALDHHLLRQALCRRAERPEDMVWLYIVPVSS